MDGIYVGRLGIHCTCKYGGLCQCEAATAEHTYRWRVLRGGGQIDGEADTYAEAWAAAKAA